MGRRCFEVHLFPKMSSQQPLVRVKRGTHFIVASDGTLIIADREINPGPGAATVAAYAEGTWESVEDVGEVTSQYTGKELRSS